MGLLRALLFDSICALFLQANHVSPLYSDWIAFVLGAFGPIILHASLFTN